jgi:hypothetical protein
MFPRIFLFLEEIYALHEANIIEIYSDTADRHILPFMFSWPALRKKSAEGIKIEKERNR